MDLLQLSIYPKQFQTNPHYVPVTRNDAPHRFGIVFYLFCQVVLFNYPLVERHTFSLSMKDNYVNLQDYYVNLPSIYVKRQHTIQHYNVNMQYNHVKIRLVCCMLT